MRILANLFWIILGGFVVALLYWVAALIFCVTLIGIPFGVQLFKLGAFALLPFGRELVTRPEEPGCLTVVMNLAWVLVGFWEIALVHLAFCIVFCITIVGIPWGVQHFKMATGAIFPFGKEIKSKETLSPKMSDSQ